MLPCRVEQPLPVQEHSTVTSSLCLWYMGLRHLRAEHAIQREPTLPLESRHSTGFQISSHEITPSWPEVHTLVSPSLGFGYYFISHSFNYHSFNYHSFIYQLSSSPLGTSQFNVFSCLSLYFKWYLTHVIFIDMIIRTHAFPVSSFSW